MSPRDANVDVECAKCAERVLCCCDFVSALTQMHGRLSGDRPEVAGFFLLLLPITIKSRKLSSSKADKNDSEHGKSNNLREYLRNQQLDQV